MSNKLPNPKFLPLWHHKKKKKHCQGVQSSVTVRAAEAATEERSVETGKRRASGSLEEVDFVGQGDWLAD